jgi:hypothetical protein
LKVIALKLNSIFFPPHITEKHLLTRFNFFPAKIHVYAFVVITYYYEMNNFLFKKNLFRLWTKNRLRKRKQPELDYLKFMLMRPDDCISMFTCTNNL